MRTFTYLLTFLLATTLSGQTLTGHVRDSTGEAVPFASVVATSCHNEQVIAYTSTDDRGRYQISVKATGCDTIVLTARGLGYRTGTVRLPAQRLPAVQDFVLAAVALQEVVIKAKTPPVVARRDTTEYDVKSFSDSTEFSVEDLLKKLPGVKVSEQGIVTYNGKTVERVLIEGDDLFSQNYPLATRNIRADMISKVQVIDRYQENPLMKGIQESDRMVMNLKIKPERKRSLSGSVTGGLGYGGETKARTHANLFSLSRKDKLYCIGNANNTGENPLSDVDFLSRGDVFDPNRQSLQNSPLQMRSLLQTPAMQKVGLPAAYTQANLSGVFCLGSVLPVSPHFKVKTSAWLGGERLRQQSASHTRYLLDGSTLDISETQAVSLRRDVRNFQSEAEHYSPDKKKSLRSFLKISGRPIAGDLDLLRSQPGSGDFQVKSPSDERTLEAFGSIEYTLKRRENTALQLIGKTAWHRARHSLHPQYTWYAQAFGLDSTYNRLRQNAGQQQSRSVASARLLTVRKSVQWLLETGADAHWGQLQSDLLLENASGETWQPSPGDYRNDLRLQSLRWFANLSAARTFGNFLLRARLHQRYQPLRLTAPGLAQPTARLWATEPRLDLRYTPGERSTFNAYYALRQNAPDLTDLHPAALFTDYALAERGLPSLTFAPKQQAALIYYFNDRLRQFSWNVGTNAQRTDNEFGTQYQISPYLSVQEKFRPVQSASWSLNAAIDRFFKNISCRVEAGGSMTALQERARINSDVLRDLDTRNYALNLGGGTAFDTWVNVVLSSRGSWSVVRSEAVAPLRTVAWFSTAQVLVRPSKKFDLKIFVHHTANRTQAGAAYRHFYASDCIGRLRLPRWHSEVELTAFNMLGQSRFEQVFADAFFQNTTAVTAVQPFFVLSWDRRF